jgi:beta-galactosidase
MKRTLGTCYYPEHWPREMWAADAKAMADAGLTWVRIGEFSWSRIEAQPGKFSWDWLDSAVKTLGDAGLKVVMGTPTATPPRWMVDRHPDMFALDAQGKPRGFGSRRHYCFSHEGYALECDRIVTLLSERYGANPAVAAWQTDNEYGCHDTTISWSRAARDAFCLWLAERYGDIDTLNAAWGNVFWSMDYASFDDIELPNLTVTEPNPAHMLAYRRFSSDQVVRFNRRQVDIIRARSQAPVSHNYMGRITDFDHFDVGADLDIATWDSYPLGFLEDRVGASPAHQKRFSRQGDPDFQAFHHDLYRAVGRGRWWVMEQQPGPVNWAPYNPAPLPGMVRLWSWEAFAHGAEAVCYFRWRQAPFAQEQMHAGLQRPDGADAQGMVEARQVAAELTAAPEVTPGVAPVALIFDYDADFAWTNQPHGQGLSYFGLVFDHYRALRALGLSVDIVAADSDDFANYRLILAPGLMHMDETLKNKLANAGAQVVLGPRSGARNAEMEIPRPLPPAMSGLDVTVSYVESLRPDTPVPLALGGAFQGYTETIDGGAEVIERTVQGTAAVMRQGNLSYVAGWGDDTALKRILARACDDARIQTRVLPDGLRCRDTGSEQFWFNYNGAPVQFGDINLPAAGVLRLDLTETN